MEEILQRELFAAKSADGLLSGNAFALAKIPAARREAVLHLVEERQKDLMTVMGIKRAVKAHVTEREFSHAMRTACLIRVKQRIEKQQLIHHALKSNA